ncbi:aldose 1-epimerase [Gemmatimonadetes bacterium T265]|nr:aldose 1-epimerase [Gemmatimonadetes bacterium T265]
MLRAFFRTAAGTVTAAGVTFASAASAQPAAQPAARGPSVTRAPFGQLADGRAVEAFTLTNAHGMTLRAITYGGIITNLRTPDRNGRFDDIVLGHDSLGGYVDRATSPYFGAIVGRYANRIAKGRFTLDGQTHQLAINNPPNSLHGGAKGFDQQIWTGTPFRHGDSVGVTFRYVSPDGQEDYPGALATRVTYTLTPNDQLVIDYDARTTKNTPVNLSQHTYWNLAGAGSPTVNNHVLLLNASRFTPVDTTLIPTGELAPVAGTPFDFRTPTAIGARLDQQQTNQQLRFGGGYDHNWVLDRNGRAGLVHAARVVDSSSGRTMDVATTQPGIQFYGGNFLDGTIHGKGGKVYAHRSAMALETQHFPDSPNHPQFPSTILRPGQTFRSRTVFTFGVLK